MKDQIEHQAKLKQIKLGSARVHDQRIYFLRNKHDQLLNNGYSLSENEALEFLNNLELEGRVHEKQS